MLKRNGKDTFEVDWKAIGVVVFLVAGLVSWVVKAEVSSARQGDRIVVNTKNIGIISQIVRENEKGIERIETDVRWIKEHLQGEK